MEHSRQIYANFTRFFFPAADAVFICVVNRCQNSEKDFQLNWLEIKFCLRQYLNIKLKTMTYPSVFLFSINPHVFIFTSFFSEN